MALSASCQHQAEMNSREATVLRIGSNQKLRNQILIRGMISSDLWRCGRSISSVVGLSVRICMLLLKLSAKYKIISSGAYLYPLILSQPNCSRYSYNPLLVSVSRAGLSSLPSLPGILSQVLFIIISSRSANAS